MILCEKANYTAGMHSMYVIGAGRSPVAKLARQLQVQVSLCTGGPHRILSTYISSTPEETVLGKRTLESKITFPTSGA